MEAVLKWVDGLKFIGVPDSGRIITIDKEGPTPMELLLLSLGGCTGMDVVSILEKMGVKPIGFEVRIKAERAKEHPRVYTRIELEYLARGDVPEDKLARAIQLSWERYCSVSAMLRPKVKLEYHYRVMR